MTVLSYVLAQMRRRAVGMAVSLSCWLAMWMNRTGFSEVI